ncbi:hypothetical protein NDU88_005463 [Pleurodeles waltl]|uniref:Uncharacterized protein n=1 Tax=Pleurodeles waltl TaxID=8319 RepID=A0AAV7MWH2_PLEWA|nr:hypothetical protein NDU88_005463 [Pleurodeles waltl]
MSACSALGRRSYLSHLYAQGLLAYREEGSGVKNKSPLRPRVTEGRIVRLAYKKTKLLEHLYAGTGWE